MAKKGAELELERSPRFVAVERRVQRIGIGGMALFAIAGALGAFGEGVLSTASARAASLEVTYERLTRQSVRSAIVIEAASTETTRIALDRAFLEDVQIHEMRPPQLEIKEEDDRVVFLVPSTAGMARLVLRVEPLHPGIFRTRVTTASGSAVELRQIVFF